jgi:hypothetical protein
VDFGSAFRADQGRLVSRKGTGTPAYSAPEVLSGEVRGSEDCMTVTGGVCGGEGDHVAGCGVICLGGV